MTTRQRQPGAIYPTLDGFDPFDGRTEMSAEEFNAWRASGSPTALIPPVGETVPDWQMNEKAFMARVVKFASEHGWTEYHTFKSANSAPGFPDLVLARMPVIRVAELKVGGNKPTKDQRWWLDAFAVAGIPADVWTPDDIEEIEEVLR